MFDDGILRIVVSGKNTFVYCPNGIGERKLMFSRSDEQPRTIYFPGAWEHYFVCRYNTMRARLK
jgi:hypothetical protein